MRKLKKFELRTNKFLSKEEMSKLYGMEYIPFSCQKEGDLCVVYATDGVNTGYCKWMRYSSNVQYMTCVPN